MIPKSLSATALQTADSCLARYWAENIERAPGFDQKEAANLGTACHAALEWYVTHVIQGKIFDEEFRVLEGYFQIAFKELFGDLDHAMYADGVAMLQRWFARTKWDKVAEVLSCEIKESFPIKTSVGEIPFNYIWDRCDRMIDPDDEGRLIIRVVDYKSIRVPVNAQQLHTKIQARCYALAAQIKWPKADEIWVQFDLLRHEPVGTRYTREENIATWKWLKDSAERIIAADETNLPSLEKLNADCKYCIRKLSCEALDKNLLVGGMASLRGVDEAVEILGNLTTQMQANSKLAEQLEAYVLRYAEENDMMEWDTDAVNVKLTVKSTRRVDPTAVARILGPTLVAQYGRITVTDIDKLIQQGRLTEEQAREVKAIIYKTTGEPTVKVTPKSPLEEE